MFQDSCGDKYKHIKINIFVTLPFFKSYAGREVEGGEIERRRSSEVVKKGEMHRLRILMKFWAQL